MTTELALSEIESLLARNQMSEAEEKLNALIYSMGVEELKVWEYDVRNVAAKFFRKRQVRLEALISQRLEVKSSAAISLAEEVNSPKVALTRFQESLSELSSRHIFQWSTFYRETISQAFSQFVDIVSSERSEGSHTASHLRALLADHSKEIFQKGYNFVAAGDSTRHEGALIKSLSGLQRFLELPIEAYTAEHSATAASDRARAIRVVASAMASGILSGYSKVSFGGSTGSQVLPRFPRSWAHYLAFLDGESLGLVCSELEEGAFLAGLANGVQPLVGALDELCRTATDYVPLPILGQLVWPYRRLEASLRPPPRSQSGRPIDVHVYLDSGFVTAGAITEGLSRDVSLILAPVRPDLVGVIQAKDGAADAVVAVGDNHQQVTRRALEVLQLAIYKRRSVLARNVPLAYNFAREFPLQNPNLARYFHVYRSSVRALLTTFEKRNGVRLWCSVRRSGKTTACFDLGATTGGSTVISQTSGTARLPDATVFYDQVVELLEASRQLPKNFLQQVLSDLAGKDLSGDRIVFVLDEYETLFGRMSAAARRDSSARYSVIQPLLNQMVEFASSNLLVLLGQQPNAHFILMDQNQLSPYVEQDPFPLFQYSGGGQPSEFRELVRRVLTERVEFEAGFVQSLFAETSGHPFLTVKVLIALVDWLIEQQRPVGGLVLTAEDFEGFAGAKLTQAEVGRSPEYSFFREAIAEATSHAARLDQPWLYGVYSALREIGRRHSVVDGCPTEAFRTVVESLGLDEIGMTADLLLGTGVQANFLEIRSEVVKPKIRILGRIAAATAPRISH